MDEIPKSTFFQGIKKQTQQSRLRRQESPDLFEPRPITHTPPPAEFTVNNIQLPGALKLR